MNMDHSAYEGFEVDGKVDTVLSRGTVVVENDTFTGRAGHGRFVKRGLSNYVN
jgi:dihydropyrimidinase